MGWLVFLALKFLVIIMLLAGIIAAASLLLFLIPVIYMKWKEVLLLVCSVILTLIIAEMLLWHWGYHPGIYNKRFHPVNELLLKDGLIADETGITKIDTRYSMPLDSFAIHPCHYLDNIFRDFDKLAKHQVDNPLAAYCKLVQSKDREKWTALDSAVIDYVSSPINADGFKSINFKNHRGKIRVLLLGDSFTWGLRAKNITSCFADILLARGYEVYNAGISGADPPQYLAVAEKYVPLLKPDIVIVNFCLANDVEYFERKPRPYTPFLFVTNAGGFETAPYGIYWDNAQQAYDFLRELCSIPQTSVFNRICSLTRVSTLLWWALAKYNHWDIQSASVTAYMQKACTQLHEIPPVNAQVDSIQNICDVCNSKLVLSIIPASFSGKPLQYVKDYKNLFPTERYFTPYTITKEDYDYTDFHFNDAGHIKYAKFLEQIIDSLTQRSVPLRRTMHVASGCNVHPKQSGI